MPGATDDRSPKEVADLYVLPPERFTPARNEMAKRLRTEGKDEEAAAVARMRKPSVAAWSLNLVARDQPQLVKALLDSHQQLRKANTGEAMQKASDARREAVAALTESAIAELESQRRPATGQTRDRINRTLLAVATDPQGEADLKSGTLVKELEPSGGGWGDIGLAPATPAPGPDRKARQAVDRARAHAEELERRAVEAERRVEQAEEALATARTRAEEARTKADRAREEAEKAGKAAEG